MRKLVVGLSICLTFGLAGLSLAANENQEAPFVTVVPGGCEGSQLEGFPSFDLTESDTLIAKWSAEIGDQTKYGGDAVFKFFGVTRNDEPLADQPVDVELAFDTDLDGMDGYFLYSCEDDDLEPPEVETCTATLPAVQLAIQKVIEGDDYGDPLITYDYEGATATLMGVLVKGMKPSKLTNGNGKKRQNFQLVDVCEFGLLQ